MPKSFPRAPAPIVAALVSPLAWLYGRPDLFDTYSCGVLLMQMSGARLLLTLDALNRNTLKYSALGVRLRPGRLTVLCATPAVLHVPHVSWPLVQHVPGKRFAPVLP